MGSVYTRLGDALFAVISWYQMGLLFLLIGGNVLVGLLYVVLVVRRRKTRMRFRWMWIVLEIVYGLCNPLVYLTIIQAFWTNRILNAVALFCLLGYWGTRLCFSAKMIPLWLKRLVQCNLLLCMVVLATFTIKKIPPILLSMSGGRLRRKILHRLVLR